MIMPFSSSIFLLFSPDVETKRSEKLYYKARGLLEAQDPAN
jgi:hypothetical protein